ncbi:CAP domain-containing protein [Nostoc sp. TCL26-01]|nr:CAP domain-containing protein [Nostoc sp. TCL26-01]
MLRTTIYAVALGTFALTSGASAVSVQNLPTALKSSSISSDHLFAQYRFPIQYRYPRRPGSSNPQQPSNPGTTNPGTTNPGTNPQQPSNPGTSNPQTPPSGQGGASNSNAASIEQAVFEQVNQYRASQGLPALSRNAAIDDQARIHSQNMASGKVPFSHQGFEQRVKALNMSYKSANENVAYNQDRDPATKAVQSWLQSSGHLANIKSNSNLTGVGVAVNGKGVVYFTQIFIRS